MSFQNLSTEKKYYKLLFLSFFVLKISFLVAQKNFSDSTEVYNYWSKRAIIEIVYAYMNDYIATITDSSLPKVKIKDCSLEKNGLNEYKKLFIDSLEKMSINDLSHKLDEISNFLKNNNWSGAEKNLLRPLLINLRVNKPLDTLFFATLKSTGNERSTTIPGYSNKLYHWNKTINEIITNYNRDLRKLEFKKKEEMNTLGDSNQNISQVSGKKSEQLIAGNQNWKLIFIIGILAFIAGMLTSIFFIKSKIYQLLGDDKEKYKKYIPHGLFSFLSVVSLLRERKDFHKKNAYELEKKIAELEKKLNSEKNVNTNKFDENVVNENSDKIIEEKHNTEKENINKMVLYFGIPKEDGSFNIERGNSTYNNDSSYYKIEYNKNSEEGLIYYISSDNDKRAINNLDYYLKPVCEIENIKDAEYASRIEVVKYGKVFKNNNNWIIDSNNKVKIKFV